MEDVNLLTKIQQAIDHWRKANDNSPLCDLLPDMMMLWEKWAEEEGDKRNGGDTYGYDDDESIANNMHYISDRWKCAFRLKWIIDGLENGRI